MNHIQIYLLKNQLLTQELAAHIGRLYETDQVICFNDCNQVEGVQYPLIKVIEDKDANNITYTIDRERLNGIISKQARQTPERNTSL